MAVKFTIAIFRSWCAKFESGTIRTRKNPGRAKKMMADANFTRISRVRRRP